jgi:hypothetical protein
MPSCAHFKHLKNYEIFGVFIAEMTNRKFEEMELTQL